MNSIALNHPVTKNGKILSSRTAWLFLAGNVALVIGIFLTNPYDYGIFSRSLSVIVYFLGLFPMIRLLFKRQFQGLPIFEVYMLFHAICFGLAGFMEQRSTLKSRFLSEDEWQTALIAVIIALGVQISCYYLFISKAKNRIRTRSWPFAIKPSQATLIVLFMLPVVVFIYLGSDIIPDLFAQISQMWVLFWFFILVSLALQNQLSRPWRVIVLYVLLPMNLLVFSTFARAALYGLFGLLIPVALIYFSSRKKIPLLVTGIVLVGFFLLQPVKYEFRMHTWYSPSGGQNDSPLDFAELAVVRFEQHLKSGGTFWNWFEDSFTRLNHLHVTAAVIADTPKRVRFKYGATYWSLFTKFIPRFIWPDKPVESIGNAWAHEYGYLHKGDFTTAFNLPFLTEMYINFGYYGLIFVSVIISICLGYLSLKFWNHDGDGTFTAYGLLLGLPFLTPESNLSLMVGRVVIGAIVGYFSLVTLAMIFPTIRVRNRQG